QVLAQASEQAGVLGEALDEDVARAFERGLRVGYVILDEGSRRFQRHEGTVGEQLVEQRLEATLARDLGPRAALRLVRQVEVFEIGLRRRGEQARFEIV